MSKSGFSTLNRWLGRKNKEKSMSNGKLSKSSTNLSVSSTNINETSQLEYNRITPLPAATTNAPFEQTFRITVLLPKDQLYVTRLGARIPLSKLLELVCDNKLLDADKYEFRNPVDSSQVYSCDLTIGAVGLSEIRLCHKSESYDNFNADEIIKLHRTSLIRESLSSSEFSSRNSKHTTKTTSPYSSSNSLNSMDSSGINCSRTPIGGPPKLPGTNQPKMAAPPRKKRTAPRPPSQMVIPEKSALIMENGSGEEERLKRSQESPLTTKDFSVSTPNLTSSTMLNSDINGNDCNGHYHHMEDYNGSSGTGSINSNGYNDDTVVYAQIQKKNALNLHHDSKLDITTNEEHSKFPEPSPRKKIVPIKKKTTAPPAPPPRNSIYQEDNVTEASSNPEERLQMPVEDVVDHQQVIAETIERVADNKMDQKPNDLPKPVPRITTTTLLNATDLETDLKSFETETEQATTAKTGVNVSKVLLNRTPTPEPRSLSCEPPDMDACYENQIEHFKQERPEDDCVSKQADSGIGEPVPSPLPDSLPSEASTLDVKSNFESSSDDDDMVKVYNFKLGKTLVKPLNETKTLEELTLINGNSLEETTDGELTQSATPNTLSETSSWNFAIPISPPPNFADNQFMENLESDSKPDTPITPKIMERPLLNFENLKQEHIEEESKMKPKPFLTPSTPLDSIVDELSTIIQEKGLDTLIKKPENYNEIESAKPNTLTNFTINSITQNNVAKPKEVLNENKTNNFSTESSTNTLTESSSAFSTEISAAAASTHIKESNLSKQSSVESFHSLTPQHSNNTIKLSSTESSPSTTPDEEKLYRKRSSVTSLKQRRSITRSDSFHTTAIASDSSSIGLNKRTSSQISLDQMNGNLNRRKSSSELSIGDTPSLQSLEIIKTILNSRKNSLANSSGDEEKSLEVHARRPSEELKFASLELKTAKLPETKEKEENKLNSEKAFEMQPQLREYIREEFKDEKPKELPKVYRYSGPPSINFSTWNERPKVQVQAIKNEGDYIFGGKANNTNNMESTKTIPRNYRMSTPLMTNKEQYEEKISPPPVAPKPFTIQRMGIPEKDFKVPVLVKPIKDVVIENIPQQQQEKKAETLELKTANKPLTQSLRPTVENVLKPQTQTIINTSTLPRSNKPQRFSTPASTSSSLPGPQLLRSSSIKQEDKIKPATTESVTVTAPFGQNTLRRTGYKEKMLAKEEQEKQKAINTPTTHSTPATPATPSLTIHTIPSQSAPILSNGDLKTSANQKFELPKQNSYTSAKLNLNIKKSTTVINSTSKTPSPITSTSFLNAALKPKSQTPKSAPAVINQTSLSPSSAPIPPPMMAIQLKPVTDLKAPLPAGNPRDQLMIAIRNFKQDNLKKP